MAFVQIIEYQTSKPDEMKALGDEIRTMREGSPGADEVKVTVVKDRDSENTYLTIVQFPSYETAMENSERDDTSEVAAKMAALCDGPPTFRNLDVIQEWGG